MAFIGADGQDRMIRSLKAQVQSKDGELASVRNELAKCKEALQESKTAQQALEYRVSMDAQGAEASGKSVMGMKNEIQQLKQNLCNRETSLQTANGTIKRLEKEKSGLEYELETAGSSSGDATRRLTEKNAKLEGEVKALKKELQQKESEEARTKAANAKIQAESGIPVSGIPRLRRPTPSTVSSTPANGSKILDAGSSRRCSTSLSNTREVELQNEVSKMKLQVSSLKLQRDKAENQRLAVEKGAKKKEEELRDQLDEAKDELEFYRSNAERGGAGADPKKVKQLEEAVKELQGKNDALQTEFEQAKDEKRKLEADAERVKELELEVERLGTQASASGQVDSLHSELEILKVKVEEQQAALAAAPSTMSDSALTQANRQLKRELGMAQHLVQTAEKERDEFETEIVELQKRLETMSTGGSSGPDTEGLQRVRTALAEAEKAADTHRARVEDLETALKGEQGEKANLQNQIELIYKTATADISFLQARLADSQSTSDRATAAQHTLQSSLDEARLEVQSSHAKVQQLQSRLDSAESDHTAMQVALTAAEGAAAESKAQLSALEARMETLQSEADAIRNQAETTAAQLQQVEGKLATSEAALAEVDVREFGAKTERDQAREARDALEKQVEALKAELLVAEQSRNSAIDEVQELEATMQAIQTELDDSKAALVTQSCTADKLRDDLQSTAADNARLEQKIAEYEEILANRSTETEAQHRQEEVFQLKDDLEAAHREKRKMQAIERQQMDEIEAKRAELERLQTKVDELERQVATLTAQLEEAKKTPPIEVNVAPAPEVEPSHIQLLHAKIERLRVQRDELLQTMSFVKHEHRFALQASEADRATAMEKLHLAQKDAKSKEAELSKKLAELEGMQKQIDETGTELDSLRGRLTAHAATQQETSELASKIGVLEADLAGVQAERVALKEDVDTLTRARDAAVSDLDAFRFQSAEAISREAKMQKEIKRLRAEQEEARDTVMPATPATPASRPPVDAMFTMSERRPASALGMHDADRRSRTHTRRQSLQDLRSAMVAPMPAVTAKDAEMQAKVDALQTEVQILQAEIRVLQKAIEEKDELFRTNDEQLREKSRLLQSRDEQIKGLEETVHATICSKDAEVQRVGRRDQRISELQSEIRALKSSNVLPDDFVPGDVTVEEIDVEAGSDAIRVAALEREISALRSTSSSTEAELQAKITALQAELEAAELDRAQISGRLDGASTDVQAVTAAAEQEKSKLSAQLKELSGHKTDLVAELENLRAQLTAGSEDRNKVDARLVEVEAELAVAHERSTVLSTEREALQSRISADQDTVRVEMEKLFTTKHTLERRVHKLEASERGLQQQVEALTAEIAAKGDAEGESLAQKDADLARVQAELSTASASLANAKVALETSEREISSQSLEVQRLGELVDGLNGKIALRDADITASAHEHTIVQERLVSATREQQTLEEEKQGLEARLADMEYAQEEASKLAAERDVLQKRIAELKQEASTLRAAQLESRSLLSERDAMSAEIEQLEKEIDELRAGQADSATLRANAEQAQQQLSRLESRIESLLATETELRQQLEQAVRDAESASNAASRIEQLAATGADLEARLATSESSNSALRTVIEKAEETIANLESQIASLKSSHEALNIEVAVAAEQKAASNAALSSAREELAQMTIERDMNAARAAQLQNEISSLRGSEGQAAAEAHEAHRAERAALQGELDSVQKKLATVESDIAEANEKLRLAEETAIGKDIAHHADLQRTADQFKTVQTRLREAEDVAARAMSADQTEQLNKELEIMKRDLSLARKSAQEAEMLVMNRETIIASLRTANEEYSRKLSASVAKQVSVDEEEVAILKETIENLEAELAQRNAECEAYDDKLAEASQTIKTMKRKQDKMVRDMKKKEKDEEVARITAMNIQLSKPTAEESAPAAKPAAQARPAPISAPSRPVFATAPIAPTPVSAPTPSLVAPASIRSGPSPNTLARQPLRKVMAFDASQMPASFATAISPLAGTKRARETEEVVKPQKADAIMVPPHSMGKPDPTKSFPAPRTNVFEVGKENLRQTPDIGNGGVKRTIVPLRNVFSPEP